MKGSLHTSRNVGKVSFRNKVYREPFIVKYIPTNITDLEAVAGLPDVPLGAPAGDIDVV